MSLNIAILGTRGIPNHYGGYEQAASFLSAGLVNRGHTVTVYSPHHHPYREKQWNGVNIVHCYDPEPSAGTAGQFFYDLNCLRHARGRQYDVMLWMGYTSSSIWGRFYPRDTVIISNMDGLEWKRTKYPKHIRYFLRYAEKLAVRYSDHYVADSPAIKQYLDEKYNIDSRFIPYGACSNILVSLAVLADYNIEYRKFCLLVARMEPENNIEMILDGYLSSGSPEPFIVVGNTGNRYGQRLVNKYRAFKRICFAGPLFDRMTLDSLRSLCRIYFHGHSVGGTNPSLLEAMSCGALICSHDNPYNKAVLNDQAFYFSSENDVRQIVDKKITPEDFPSCIKDNLDKISQHYTWDKVISQYESFILECHINRQR